MKSLMLLGGLLGLIIGLAFALAQRSPWPDALWRAAASALLAALLLRWWGRVWIRGLRDALHQQQAELLAQRKDAQKS